MDCAIVKTIKYFKTMKYNDLLAKTVPLIRLFAFDIAFFKKRLEVLITLEYISRVKGIYNYVTG